MKANELRIGNYVNVPRADQSPFRIDAFEYLSEKFIKVAMIHPEHGEDFHPLTWYGNDLTPIQITEELLLKCGFDKDFEYFEFLKDNEFFISYNIFKKQMGIYINGTRGGRYWIDCLYLHQLQNLFFALTNQELKINL